MQRCFVIAVLALMSAGPGYGAGKNTCDTWAGTYHMEECAGPGSGPGGTAACWQYTLSLACHGNSDEATVAVDGLQTMQRIVARTTNTADHSDWYFVKRAKDDVTYSEMLKKDAHLFTLRREGSAYRVKFDALPAQTGVPELPAKK